MHIPESNDDQKQWKVFREELQRDAVRRGIVPPPLDGSVEKKLFKQWKKGADTLKKLSHGI